MDNFSFGKVAKYPMALRGWGWNKSPVVGASQSKAYLYNPLVVHSASLRELCLPQSHTGWSSPSVGGWPDLFAAGWCSGWYINWFSSIPIYNEYVFHHGSVQFPKPCLQVSWQGNTYHIYVKFLGSKGDWPWLRSSYHLQSGFASTRKCHLCDAREPFLPFSIVFPDHLWVMWIDQMSNVVLRSCGPILWGSCL